MKIILIHMHPSLLFFTNKAKNTLGPKAIDDRKKRGKEIIFVSKHEVSYPYLSYNTTYFNLNETPIKPMRKAVIS